MLQSRNCFPFEREALGSIPKTYLKGKGGKPGRVACTCNPSTGEVETGSSLQARWPVSLAHLVSSRSVGDRLKTQGGQHLKG